MRKWRGLSHHASYTYNQMRQKSPQLWFIQFCSCKTNMSCATAAENILHIYQSNLIVGPYVVTHVAQVWNHTRGLQLTKWQIQRLDINIREEGYILELVELQKLKMFLQSVLTLAFVDVILGFLWNKSMMLCSQ